MIHDQGPGLQDDAREVPEDHEVLGAIDPDHGHRSIDGIDKMPNNCVNTKSPQNLILFFIRFYNSQVDSSGKKYKQCGEKSNVIGVFNMDFNTSERKLEREMEQFGRVERVVIVERRDSRRSAGYSKIAKKYSRFFRTNIKVLAYFSARICYFFT